MSIRDVAKKVLPGKVSASIARSRRSARKAKIAALAPLSERRFRSILSEELQIAAGDTVYVGSAVDQLSLDFPFYRILHLIRDVIGPNGSILFPTYPNRSPMSSYDFLVKDKVFDVRRSPSFTGVLSEHARRLPDAVRSLHPTKSVCAIGPYAEELTRSHRESPYPYDVCSPYYKLVERDAKIIGLGVWTEYLSFVYTIDDALKENPPVETYHPHLFKAKCRNEAGEIEIVETYAHNMKKVVHDVPRFMKEHIARELCEDLNVEGMRFFRANAGPLFHAMLALAIQGITVYPRRLYSKRFVRSLSLES